MPGWGVLYRRLSRWAIRERRAGGQPTRRASVAVDHLRFAGPPSGEGGLVLMRRRIAWIKQTLRELTGEMRRRSQCESTGITDEVVELAEEAAVAP